MTSKIRVLQDHIINQIAAGEVIENPASVVKELVENSLDAGATEITVEIKAGGRQLIRIVDNGSGMSSDDAVLCLERHATSKIKNLSDLNELGTMGFRGEAVPSIASISKFTLLTRSSAKEGKATMVIVDGGRLINCCEAERSPGTTVEVKSLFFNVPVRKKFQRSVPHDIGEIHKMVSTLALGNPHVKFQLISQQSVLFSTVPWQTESFQESIGARIKDVLGEQYFCGLCPLDFSEGEFSLRGFIGAPSFHRHNRTGQFLFINQRPVISPQMAFALREGYGTMLPSGRYPVFVLHLQVPGKFVDVNVHPQKREVRLRQEISLKTMVLKAVQKALQPMTVETREETATRQEQVCFAPQAVRFPSLMEFTERVAKEEEQNVISFAPEKKVIQEVPKQVLFREEPRVMSEIYKAALPIQNEPHVIGIIGQYVLVDASSLPASMSSGGRSGLVLVDRRAAYSRIVFEKLSKEELKEERSVESQALLVPLMLECSSFEAAALERGLEELNMLGVCIRSLGGNTFVVDSLPASMDSADVRDLISDIIEQDSGGGVQGGGMKRMALVASQVTHYLRKALTIEEARLLLKQLLGCQNPLQSPQGRPVLIVFDEEEIAKRFR